MIFGILGPSYPTIHHMIDGHSRGAIGLRRLQDLDTDHARSLSSVPGRIRKMRPMMPDAYRHGLQLFNQGEFFETHEVLEDVWRAAPAEDRRFLQGLIQVAVALHHHSTGNLVGCRSVLARAWRNLSLYPTEYAGLDLAALLANLEQWRHALETGQSLPAPPHLVLRPSGRNPDPSSGRG